MEPLFMHHPIYAKTLFMHAFWGSTSLVPIRPHAFLFMHLHNYFEAKKRVRVPPYDFAFHPFRCHGSHSSSLFLVCLYVTSSPNDTRSVKKASTNQLPRIKTRGSYEPISVVHSCRKNEFCAREWPNEIAYFIHAENWDWKIPRMTASFWDHKNGELRL